MLVGQPGPPIGSPQGLRLIAVSSRLAFSTLGLGDVIPETMVGNITKADRLRSSIKNAFSFNASPPFIIGEK